MARITETAPPRLLNSELIVLPHDDDPRPLLCVVTMDTDDGAIELALNVAVAEQLQSLLAEFLEKANP